MNNVITLDQWNIILEAVIMNGKDSMQNDDVVYSGKTVKNNKTRHYIYDNYDRFESPGLDFVIQEGCDSGRLTVYNGSEQTYAPVDFEKGLDIANNFFNSKGYLMSEEIVCDYVMDGNPLISLWRQESCNVI